MKVEPNLERARQEGRAAALEEAARIAEDRHLLWHRADGKTLEVYDEATACADIAMAIRSLISI